MRIFRLGFAAVAAVTGLTGLVAAAPTAALPPGRRAAVPYPADDPFYIPPAGYGSKAPGTILRSRSVSASFFSLVPDPVEAWQLLYRSTAVNGSAIATVTTVFKPLVAKLDRFVSYATAYDSSWSACDPSYDYRLGSNSTSNQDTNEEFLLITGYLLQGYIVSSSDYEGPDAAFTPGHLEGMCILDSLRAVSNFADTLGLSTSTPDIVAVGYSGGAIATGWAAALQNTYAPELPVKGWAHGGTPANLTGVTLYIANTSNSGFLPAAVAGLSAPSAYGATLGPVLDQILTDTGKQALAYVESHCMSDDLSKYADTSLLSYEFQKLGPAVLQQPTFASILTDNILGLYANQTPIAPVLVYHASQDEIIPYANASALVDRWCSRGADITFTTYEVGGHVSTAILGSPEVWEFVDSAFAGTVAKGCIRNSKLATVADLLALASDLAPIIPDLIALLESLGSAL